MDTVAMGPLGSVPQPLGQSVSGTVQVLGALTSSAAFENRALKIFPWVSICTLTSGQVVEAAWDRKEPAVTGEGDTGEEGLLDTGGTRAALDTGLQGEDAGVAMLESPRAAAAAAAAAASTWRCWSGACWAASCNCTNIM